MNVRMIVIWAVCFACLGALVVMLAIWVAQMPRTRAEDPPAAWTTQLWRGAEDSPAASTTQLWRGAEDSPVASATQPRRGAPVLRIGLIPERDVFEQRRRYRALADYLSGRLGGRVDLVTHRTYRGILQDFEDKRVDAAFLGSFVTVLAMDRLGVKVLAKPVLADGISTYHGVIFVPQGSPIRKLEDLSGRSIAAVRTTTAGQLFAVCAMTRLGLLEPPSRPKVVWLGTHDDVARKVMDGECDAGAIKNLRLDALARSHPAWKIRRLAGGRCVPNNALCLRADVAGRLGAKLSEILLNMARTPQGREALRAIGARHFAPCQAEDYEPIYDMAECIGPAWEQLGESDPLPRRPADWPKPDPTKPRRCYDVNY